MLSLLTLIASLATTSGHVAQSDYRFHTCADEGDAASFREAIVQTPRALHLKAIDDEICGKTKIACFKASWVRSGAKVLVYKQRGPYACVIYKQGISKEAIGYLPVSNLRVLQDKSSISAWTGRWRRLDAQFDISNKGGALRVAGQATLGPPSYNIALTSGSGKPLGDELDFVGEDDYACHVRMRLVGDFLIVNNDDECGGHDVYFSGIYVKSRRGIDVV